MRRLIYIERGKAAREDAKDRLFSSFDSGAEFAKSFENKEVGEEEDLDKDLENELRELMVFQLQSQVFESYDCINSIVQVGR